MRERGIRDLTVSAAVVVLGMPSTGLAAVGGGDWRATWDLVLLWVNFFILAALLIKYLRKPFRGFLKARWEAVAAELQRLEAEKTEAEAAVQRFQESLEARRNQSEALHRRLVERGRRERQDLVEAALRQAEILMRGAQARAENRMREAREALKAEMVDGAVELAMKALPRRIGPEDERRWLDHFTEQVLGRG